MSKNPWNKKKVEAEVLITKEDFPVEALAAAEEPGVIVEAPIIEPVAAELEEVLGGDSDVVPEHDSELEAKSLSLAGLDRAIKKLKASQDNLVATLNRILGLDLK